MEFRKKILKKENSIWALAFTLLLWLVIAGVFDFYYDLNDDMLIKDIVSGIYSGTPSGYNMQMHYPLSFVLSLLYRIVGSIPWYGLYFLVVQFGCIYLITERLLSFFESRIAKVAVLFIETGMILLLFLWELVFVQYTVACGLLAATAAFRMYTGEKEETVSGFLKQNIGNILLVILAFLTRSEMLLLMLPFICIAGVMKWADEKPIFTKKNATKYFSLFGIIMAGVLLCQVLHTLAYSGKEWKEFSRFFDERTEFYDFHKIPPYAENTDFYNSIGMDESDWHLLVEWYNFGLEENFDADYMAGLAAYAKEHDKEKTSFKETFKKAFIDYRYRALHETDYPYNMIVIAMYAMVLMAGILMNRYRFVWELLFAGGVRSVVWLYMQSRERMPERITHSLYLIEFLILLAALLVECKYIKEKRHKYYYNSLVISFGCIFFLLIAWHGNRSLSAVEKEYDRREELNTAYLALLDYVKQDPQTIYFADVFSTVPYSTKIMADQSNAMLNMELVGGWFNKSPLSVKKLEALNLVNMEDALIHSTDVLFVIKADEEYANSMSGYIEDHYKKDGKIIALKKIDSVKNEEKEVFYIYQVIGE